MYNRRSTSMKPYILGGVAAFVVIVLLIGGCSYAGSFDAPRRGYSAVCQTGGPIEGDSGTCGFLAAGSGKSSIGFQNTLIEFPAQKRQWRAASDPSTGSKLKGADVKAVELPTSNGGIVTVEYQMRFGLDQTEKSMLDFYKKFATRTWGGPKAEDDPDGWWESFLLSQMNPAIEKNLREKLGPYSCADLNPSCDLTKLNADLEQLASEQAKEVEAAQDEQSERGRQANQKLSQISQEMEDALAGPVDAPEGQGDLAKTLEGEFLTDIDFQIIKVTPPADLISEINGANAALATLVKANADARAATAKAKGEADARREEAAGIRAINEARSSGGKLAAQIQAIRALCGEVTDERGQTIAKGCGSLQVLGGGSDQILNLGK